VARASATNRKSLTAKIAKGAKETKSFTAKVAKDAKGTIIISFAVRLLFSSASLASLAVKL
jgi:hypothetical protein